MFKDSLLLLAFILRSNDGDVLSCLGIKTYCIAASFSGGINFNKI